MEPNTELGLRRKLSAEKRRFGIGTRRVARRVAAVDAYEFPSSVRQRLRLKHAELRTEHLTLIEVATRQWFRLHARRPTARLSMPSKLVDDMWHEMVLHTRDYAAFCDSAFGRFLHHEPESNMSPKQALANRSERLLATLLLARADEDCAPDALPLLFRVDQEVGLEGTRRYISDCGDEQDECYDHSNPRLVCLAHIAGSGRLPSGRSQPRGRFRGNALWMGPGYGASYGAGCGGGDGCGGCGCG